MPSDLQSERRLSRGEDPDFGLGRFPSKPSVRSDETASAPSRSVYPRISRADARKTRSIMHTQRPSVVVDHARSSSRPLGKTREEPAGAGRPRSISTRHPTLPRLLWLSHARELDSRHTSMLHSFAAIDRRGPWNQPGVSWVWPVSAHLPPIVADPMEQWLYSMQMWPDGQTRPPANLLTFHSWSE